MDWRHLTARSRRLSRQRSGAALSLSPSFSRATWLGLAAVSLFFLARYLWVLDVAWINDDFLFLERARTSSFVGNLSAEDAIGNAYRPLSRNFYFWTARRAFGTDPTGYHAVSLLVGLVGLVLFFLVLRRLFGGRGDGPALLGALVFAAHPVAATPVAWACGMQDLLCVALACGAFLAFLSGRRLLYPALVLAAVLSKEAAVGLPFVIGLYDVLVRRTRWKHAIGDQLPAFALLAVWAVANPWLPWADRGSQVHSEVPGRPALLGRHDAGAMILALKGLVLAEPKMEFAWPYGWAATAAQVAFAALALFVALRAAWPKMRARGLTLVGLAWIAAGVLPLFAVVSRFLYYGYYPSLGAALVVSALLLPAIRSSRAVWAGAGRLAAIAVIAVLFVGAGHRHHPEMLDGHAVRRSSEFLHRFETDLRAMHPRIESGSRLFFWNIPVNIGFQLADGIALRVWYADTTLRGAWMNEYQPEAGHRAYFFGHDGEGHLFEIVRGNPDPYLMSPPRAYADCHNDLGVRLANVGDLPGAEAEWRKVLQAQPNHPRALENLALARLDAGKRDEGAALLERSVRSDSSSAQAWYYLAYTQLERERFAQAAKSAERALSLVDDPAKAEEMREVARKARSRAGTLVGRDDEEEEIRPVDPPTSMPQPDPEPDHPRGRENAERLFFPRPIGDD